MWPLNVSQLALATAPDAEPLVPIDDEVGRRALYRAIAWPGGNAGKQDVLFVVERAMHAEVKDALERGAICVVPQELGSMEGGLRRHILVSERPLAAFRRFAAFMRSRLFLPTVAVGGSNGKTTTKEMIVAALSGPGRRITATPGTNNGWVGVPTTLCHPWHTEPLPDALVLEIGIDEKGAMQEHVELARPNVAVLTALGVEHLAGLGSHDEAIREELELFRAPRRIWNAEEPALAARLGDARKEDVVVHDVAHPVTVPCPTLAFAWRAADDANGTLDLVFGEERTTLFVPLPGLHNGRNAALAIGTALALGRSLSEATRGFASFTKPKQRCAVTRLRSGCVLIDDTYNASPSSIDAALDVLRSLEPDRPRLVVLGDMLDLGEASGALHDELVPKLDAIPNAHIRLYGEQMSALAPKLTRPLSIGKAKDDPLSLVDVNALEAHVVLVKGSRGMRLERVVDEVIEREKEERLEIAVVGTREDEMEAVARALRAALGTIANVRTTRFPQRLDLVVLTPFTPRDDDDAEALLAEIAQLFVTLDADAGAVLAKADEEDEAPALLLSVAPSTLAHKHVASAPNQISIAISVAHELGRKKAAGDR